MMSLSVRSSSSDWRCGQQLRILRIIFHGMDLSCEAGWLLPCYKIVCSKLWRRSFRIVLPLFLTILLTIAYGMPRDSSSSSSKPSPLQRKDSSTVRPETAGHGSILHLGPRRMSCDNFILAITGNRCKFVHATRVRLRRHLASMWEYILYHRDQNNSPPEKAVQWTADAPLVPFGFGQRADERLEVCI